MEKELKTKSSEARKNSPMEYPIIGKSKVASANSASKATPAKGKKLGARKPAQIKYRGPGGETWSGRGKTPVWIRSFIAAGHKQEDYKV